MQPDRSRLHSVIVAGVNVPLEPTASPVRLGVGLVFVALVSVAVLQGCATLSEEDCLTLDWAVLGEADGQLGRPLSDLNQYRKDCAKYDVVPDTQAYVDGRQRGLAVFCTEDNGYREGRNGASGRLVCPAALEPGFRWGYELGRAVYASVTELRASNDSIVSARSEIEHLESEVDDHMDSARADDIDDKEKQALLDEIDDMERRIDELEKDIGILVATLAVSVAQYHDAVGAARREGYDEPMETELLGALRRLAE